MNFDKGLIQFCSWILYLIPLALLSGPAIPDVMISVIGICFIFISIKQKNYKYFKNYFSYIFFTFCILILISSLISDYKINSLESSLFYFRFGLFSLAVWFLIDCNNYFLRNFTYTFIVIFLIALFDAYYQNFYEVNIFGISTELNSRLVLLFSDQAYLGGYLSRLVPLLIGLIIFVFYLNKNRTYLFVCLLLIFTDVAVYLSGERTAIVLLLIASLSIIIFIRNFRLIRIITLIISVFIVFVFSIFDSELKNRNIDATYNQIFQQKQGKIAMFSTHHESHYITAFRMFKDKPIFGHGPNSFRYACNIEKYNYDERSCSTHPHNIYIQLAAEIGIIGLLVFLIFPIYLFYLLICHLLSHFSIKFRKISDFEVCLITAFILTVFPFLPSLNFFNNYINIIYYLPIGFFLYSYNINKDK